MRERKAEKTRERILQAGFEEMYQHGFQGMRIDAVLQKTQLAKGALYHHFPNKKSLGYAIVEEILFEHTKELIAVLNDESDPIEANCSVLMHICEHATDETVSLGCPVNNLSQEMSGLDEGFKERLCGIYTHWSETISSSLKHGQNNGCVRANVDTDVAAGFIISSFQGITGAAKCMGSKEVLVTLTAVLCDYIRTLRG
tara:strand:- start:7 stop:603 length:597 start_codon:yes stop_codon:yes gene_type:complete